MNDIQFSGIGALRDGTPTLMRRDHANVAEPNLWFARYNLLSINPDELNINPNGLGPIRILRESFQRYIVQTPLENNSIGIEILYMNSQNDTDLHRILLVRRTYSGQTELRRIHYEPGTNDYVENTQDFGPANVFQNNQITQVIRQLSTKFILQIALCEIYNDDPESRTHDMIPFTVPIRTLYRNIPARLLEYERQQRERRMHHIIEPDDEVATELTETPVPEPMPPINRASYDGSCAYCGDDITMGCRVNCTAGHIYHCDCLTDGMDYLYNHGQQFRCPKCRQEINSFYRVVITPQIQAEVSAFGKKRLTITEINKMIRYLNKFS